MIYNEIYNSERYPETGEIISVLFLLITEKKITWENGIC